ncbi:MAG: hypothetical protein NTW19_03265 [Planctomycetota bacterium]|nr:hypothetical protein [Planctomycetota bacterium]
MGWLLRKKRSKPTVRRNAGAAIDPKPWNPARTLANIEALAAVVLLAGIAIGWQFAQGRLVDYVHKREMPRIGGKQVELADAPAWMSPRLRTEIQMSVADVASGDPLDMDSLERVVQRLSRDPWVEQVRRVQRLPEGRLRILADYREPVATVQTPEGFHLVDLKGVRLPGVYQEEQLGAVGLPRIVGVRQPPGVDGEIWPGDDVKAGLTLIRLLHNEPYMPQITAFDVGQRYARDRIRLAIKTRRGLVFWGSPPGQELAMEPDAKEKKRRLNEIRGTRNAAGAIDAGGRTIEIDGPATFFVLDSSPQSAAPQEAVTQTTETENPLPEATLAPQERVQDQPQDRTVNVGYTWSR